MIEIVAMFVGLIVHVAMCAIFILNRIEEAEQDARARYAVLHDMIEDVKQAIGGEG